ncbi:MAG: FKBP-type peptidyl-prolyl cis-trans isomerase [Solirubrobacteraceae bacterium]
MTYFKTSPSIIRRTGLAAAALGATVLIAGCGSGGSSTITVGNENSADNALIRAGEKSSPTSTKCPSGSPTPCALAATTPTSGPLSKEPKVTPPSGPAPTKLETKELIRGTGPEATAGDTVTVNDVGVLYATGKQFENTFTRKEPSTFALSGLIPGFSKGIPGMKVGGRRELIIPASLGYGKRGSPPKIPPNAPLVFVVDLLGV